jgi:hypothetical protein
VARDDGGVNNLPSSVIKPEAIGTDASATIMLEGQEIQVVGDQQGDLDHSSFAWLPSLKLVVTGDIVYSGTYPWTLGSTPESRKAWLASVARIKALSPAAVVPGHGDPSLSPTPEALTFMEKYLGAYEMELPKATSAEMFTQRMEELFPIKVSNLALTLAAAKAFAK